jgi:hypothetical protein
MEKEFFVMMKEPPVFGLLSRFALDQIYQGCNGPQIPFDYTETKGILHLLADNDTSNF